MTTERALLGRASLDNRAGNSANLDVESANFETRASEDSSFMAASDDGEDGRGGSA